MNSGLDSEFIEIDTILSHIGTLHIDDGFSIQNNGVSYMLGNDSKVISKIYEIIITRELKERFEKAGYECIENKIQNKYPDFIITSKQKKENYYAIDIKSTYLKNKTHVNGFTLGTYKGYFLDRLSLKSIVKPYNTFLKHVCICVIYEREYNKIPVKHILVREKWKIAINTPGSGNTCNIGSVKSVVDLIENKPYFKTEKEFNEFWLRYRNRVVSN